MDVEGIILAGGLGTRLHPLTKVINKHLLPVFDKPMIYYPLATLMLANIRDIMIITNPQHKDSFDTLIGDGSQWGLNIEYAEQQAPNGIAECFLIGEKFLDGNACCLILGDNIFYSNQLSQILAQVKENIMKCGGGCIFGSHVKEPRDYGVVEFDTMGNIISIEEKPKCPKSHWAVPGLYFYDSNVVDYAKTLNHSARGELEITDLNNIYHQRNALKLELLGRGTAWFDVGSPERLIQASMFVQMIQDRQNLKICCPDEIALSKQWQAPSREYQYVQNF